MSDNSGSYRVVDLTRGRRVWLNTLDISWPAHPIYGLLEVDVTVARRAIAEHKQSTGETLSFTGYLTYCLAQAVEEDKSVQAYRKRRKKLVLFEDVDVGLMIERKVGEKRALMGHVIRRANQKTYRDIHDEIRQVQATPVPPGRGMPSWFRAAMLLPWPLSRLFKSLMVIIMRGDPAIAVSMAGTISISSVGMFGGGHGGWGLSPTPQPLALVVGSIATKPSFVGDQIEPREILHLTVMFDHDITDGGPAARFTQRLVELIESGHGLE
jgi:pyruvate/2-oxoglutarate dehydrogenase complex dihydrolipoamide acyltransferase (E2) component